MLNMLSPLNARQHCLHRPVLASTPSKQPSSRHATAVRQRKQRWTTTLAAEGAVQVETAAADANADAGPSSSPVVERALQLTLQLAATVIPHPDKAQYGGEDAYFTSNVGGGAFGVADGVGGWAESGVNPAEYSRTLMRTVCAYLEGPQPSTSSTETESDNPTPTSSAAEPLEQPSNASSAPEADQSMGPETAIEPTDPAEVSSTASPSTAAASEPAAALPPPPPPSDETLVEALRRAHGATQLPGSSTACIAQLDQSTGQLRSANLGDSGYAVFRDGRLVFRSQPLQHFFDCPFQFGSLKFVQDTDRAEDAELASVDLQEGDVIVAATDGLWDNAHIEELEQLLPSGGANLQQAAEAIAQLASQHAQDPEYDSPYTQEAQKQGFDIPWWDKVMGAKLDVPKFELPSEMPKFGLPTKLPRDLLKFDLPKMPEQMPKLQLGKLKGGKLDDITVVIARVAKE